MFLVDFSTQNTDIRSFFKTEKEYTNYLNSVNRMEKQRRSPGITMRDTALIGAGFATLPVTVKALRIVTAGGTPKNWGKNLIGKSAALGLVGMGGNMLLRSPRDLKGEGGRNKKEKRLLKNVGRGALTGAGLAGLSALTMRGRGYGLKDLTGKSLNRIAAGAALGSGTAYLGTKAYNKLKKDETNDNK